MNIETVLLFFLVSIGGSIIQSVTGFGFAIFCMSIYPYLLSSYHEATAVAGLCSATMAIFIAVRHRKEINLKMVAPLLVGYFIAFPFGVRLTLIFDEAVLVRALGVILIALSIYFLFFSDRITIRPTPLGGLLCGLIGGTSSGFCSIGGPPVVLYLLSAAKSKEEYRASIQFYFCIGNWYGVIVRFTKGLITQNVVTGWGIALLALLIGGVIGGKIFNKVNAKVLRRMVYGFMAVSGVTMLF